ncbi:FtsQ-type POTRA domain-containing protein [Granulosicoccaceae sp. 1_MG-2023]|nr:FtsQ-type POTRA domain-containing protein [Granulosicoccaceae sp. 1_MG-2023]
MSASANKIGHNGGVAPTLKISRYRLLFPLAVLAVICLIGTGAFFYLNDAVRFPVARVEVGGKVVFTDKTQLMQIVRKHTQRGFFGLDIEQIRTEVVSLPWVRESYVRRVLPDRLHIDVVERKPALQWNDNGLVDEGGTVFYPPQLQNDAAESALWRGRFAGLPHLSGADERSDRLLETFRHYQSMLGEATPALLGLFEDGRQSQTLYLDGNVVVRLGNRYQEDRVARFRELFSGYVKDGNRSDIRFDMRYTNGFAVAALRSENLDTGYN